MESHKLPNQKSESAEPKQQSSTGSIMRWMVNGYNLITGTGSLVWNVAVSPYYIATNIYEYFKPTELKTLFEKLANIHVPDDVIHQFFGDDSKTALFPILQKAIFYSLETNENHVKVLLAKLAASDDEKFLYYGTGVLFNLKAEKIIAEKNISALTSDAAIVLCELKYLTKEQIIDLADNAHIIFDRPCSVIAFIEKLITYEELNFFRKNKNIETILSPDGLGLLRKMQNYQERAKLMETLAFVLTEKSLHDVLHEPNLLAMLTKKNEEKQFDEKISDIVSELRQKYSVSANDNEVNFKIAELKKSFPSYCDYFENLKLSICKPISPSIENNDISLKLRP